MINFTDEEQEIQRYALHYANKIADGLTVSFYGDKTDITDKDTAKHIALAFWRMDKHMCADLKAS